MAERAANRIVRWARRVATAQQRGPTARVAELLIRGIGLTYLIALIPAIRQLPGLMGPNGVQPAVELLAWARSTYGLLGGVAHVPTLAWLGSTDLALLTIATVGALGAIPLVLGYASRLIVLLPWLCFLSIVTVGGEAFQYIWDQFLLEAGFLCVLVPTTNTRPERPAGFGVPARIALLALNFKLWFSMAWVKLLLGGPHWVGGTYLSDFFLAQPMPNRWAWYAAALPSWLVNVATRSVLVVEFFIPFAMFAGRRARRFTFVLIAALMCAIHATGNYAFFNILTIVVGLVLLDDGDLPARLRLTTPRGAVAAGRGRAVFVGGYLALTAVLLGSLLVPGGTLPLQFLNHTWMTTLDHSSNPAHRALGFVPARAADLRISNPYGVFGSRLGGVRNELFFEARGPDGSWEPYVLRYQARDPLVAPTTYAPLFPRADHQVFYEGAGAPFAMLRRQTLHYDEARIFGRSLVLRMFEGSPAVLDLFASTPATAHPPEAIRMTHCEYYFTTPAERAQSGAWWRRERCGVSAVWEHPDEVPQGPLCPHPMLGFIEFVQPDALRVPFDPDLGCRASDRERPADPDAQRPGRRQRR